MIICLFDIGVSRGTWVTDKREDTGRGRLDQAGNQTTGNITEIWDSGQETAQ